MNPDILYKMETFFVPNETYMVEYFGEDITKESFDCYSYSSYCKWQGYLVTPVKDLVGTIVGLAGFNPYNRILVKEQGMLDVNYYKVSNKEVFDRYKYLFMPYGTFNKAMEDGYLVVIDGNFDMMNLNQQGILAGSLLGSYFNDLIIAQLSCIDVLYVAIDNDEAGLTLLNKLKRRHPNVYSISQEYFKDVDDVIKSDISEDFINKLKKHVYSKTKSNFYYKKRLDLY